MDFNLSKEQELVMNTAREFSEKELKPITIDNDETREFPIEEYKKLGSMGMLGLPYSKEYGGSGGDYLSYVC